MYQIRSWLYVGQYRESIDSYLLMKYDIGAILELVDRSEQSKLTTCYLPIDDGVPIPELTLEKGIKFIREQKKDGRSVLSACWAGISRSVTFAIGALMEEENLNVWDAYRTVLEEHPHAMPHPLLIQSLLQYNGEDMDAIEIADQLLVISEQYQRK